MQIDVDYPDLESERTMVLATTANRQHTAQSIFGADDLTEIQTLVRDMPVGDSVVEAILTLVRRARPHDGAPDIVNEYVSWAPGPRASQALMLCARAAALLDGRAAPSVDDVIDLAEPVLKHRMALNYHARADGVTLCDVLKSLTDGL
jgi:MoxR-like ATPase